MWHVGDESNLGLWPLVATDGIHMHVAALVKHHDAAIRIAELLNRHGLEDCSTDDLAAALLDLTSRVDYVGTDDPPGVDDSEEIKELNIPPVPPGCP